MGRPSELVFPLSKFSLPYLDHPAVPRTHVLPGHVDDPENWVLKPLYSFAGLGVIVGPTREQVAACPTRTDVHPAGARELSAGD